MVKVKVNQSHYRPEEIPEGSRSFGLPHSKKNDT